MADITPFEIGKKYPIRFHEDGEMDLTCLQYRFRPPVSKIEDGEVCVEQVGMMQQWKVALKRVQISSSKKEDTGDADDITRQYPEENFEGKSSERSTGESLLLWKKERGEFTVQTVRRTVNLTHIPHENPNMDRHVHHRATKANSRLKQLRSGTGKSRRAVKEPETLQTGIGTEPANLRAHDVRSRTKTSHES